MNWLDRKINEFIVRVRDNPKTHRMPIGPVERPTYWRFFVWPRNRILNCYLHYWLKDDEEDFHDHRAANISFILQGDYYEERFLFNPEIGQELPPTDRILRCNHSLTFRFPSWPHRVVLRRDTYGSPMGCWSLFIKFPDTREWGFWTEEAGKAKWVNYKDYVEDPNPLSEGYGRRKKT